MAVSTVRIWACQGPTHHVALGLVHQVRRIRMVADLLGLTLDVIE